MSNSTTIGTKISKRMEKMVLTIVKRDTHLTKGELTRTALREYIKNNYSEIFEEFTQKKAEEVEESE